MDPVKIIIFVAAFAVLLILGRILSSRAEVHAAELSAPRAGPDSPADGGGADSDGPSAPVLIGAEIPFPIRLPAVKKLPDGTFNRPNFLNYYFAKVDLLRGPSDPGSFCDLLTVEAEDPATGMAWAMEYTVATPVGLRQIMDQERFSSLYIETNVVIVERWDLAIILQTVTDEITKSYRVQTGANEPPATQ